MSAGDRGELGTLSTSGLSFCYRRGTVDEVVLADSYQPERFAMPGLTAARPVIVDVGAHIGAFAAMAARSAPRAAIYALEPARSSFELLEKNIAANHLVNVVALRLALSERDGPVPLYHAAENWGHSLSREMADGTTSELVPCQTLGSFLADHSLAVVDFMKMNIEGAEYDALLAASRPDLRRIRHLTVEVHPVRGRHGDDIARWLAECGFDVAITWSQEEVGKGWLQAALADNE
jgi:FkbM family methyltransferase